MTDEFAHAKTTISNLMTLLTIKETYKLKDMVRFSFKLSDGFTKFGIYIQTPLKLLFQNGTIKVSLSF